MDFRESHDFVIRAFRGPEQGSGNPGFILIEDAAQLAVYGVLAGRDRRDCEGRARVGNLPRSESCVRSGGVGWRQGERELAAIAEVPRRPGLTQCRAEEGHSGNTSGNHPLASNAPSSAAF